MNRADVIEAYRNAKEAAKEAWAAYQDAYRERADRDAIGSRLYFWRKAQYQEAKARRDYYFELLLSVES